MTIPWWNIEIGEDEKKSVCEAIQNRFIGQGALTEQLEKELARHLGVYGCVCTTSGTTALLMAFIAIGIKPDDELILPAKTFIATAHAALLLGAKIKLVDVEKSNASMDFRKIEKQISSKTRVIVPVHLNGRAAAMPEIQEIAGNHGLTIVEDAAQGLFSRTATGKFLGTFGRFGCFSLGMAKLITSGQGGFIICHNAEDMELLKRIRNQGVLDAHALNKYNILAANFKFTDIQAALVLPQLKGIESRLKHQKKIHDLYAENLINKEDLKFFPVNVEKGECPMRAEILSSRREEFISVMMDKGVQIVPQSPALQHSPHIGCPGQFPNADYFGSHTATLPSGPNQPLHNVLKTIEIINNL